MYIPFVIFVRITFSKFNNVYVSISKKKKHKGVYCYIAYQVYKDVFTFQKFSIEYNLYAKSVIVIPFVNLT